MASVTSKRSSTVWTIYARLRQAGWSHAQSCGMLGNIAQESGFRTTALGFDGTGSYGLCQWLGPRKRALFQFARDGGRDASAVATQVDFLLHELGTTEQTAARRLRDCATATDAAVVFSKYYERPHPKFAHNDRRIRNAERYAKAIPDAL